MQERKDFSAFSEALAAVKKAKMEEGGLKITFLLDDTKANAVGTIIATTTMLPSSSGIFDITDTKRAKYFGSDDGRGAREYQIPANEQGDRIIISRNPETQETTMIIPLRPGVGEHTAKTQFANNLQTIREMLIGCFEQDVPRITYNDPEGPQSINGEYLVFPAKSPADVRLMGYMMSTIAAAHGFNHHVHNLMEPHQKLGNPAILITEDARNTIVAAERQKGLPDFR